MDLKNLSDSEFQKAIDALPSYNYELALKIDGLTTISQIPEKNWDEFVAFYKEYKNPRVKKDKRPVKAIFIFLCFGLSILFYFQLPLKFQLLSYSITRVFVLIYIFSKFWLRFLKSKSNTVIGVFNNYFLAWESSFNYKGKTNRIEFWQSYLPHLLVSNLLLYFAGYSLLNEPHRIFEINEKLKTLGSSYDLAYVVVSVPLIIRRLRDIGKKNKVLWFFLSMIPIYGLFIFSKPSLKKANK